MGGSEAVKLMPPLDRENENKWKLIETVGPIPYLPNNPEYGDKIQVILFQAQYKKHTPKTEAVETKTHVHAADDQGRCGSRRLGRAGSIDQMPIRP